MNSIYNDDLAISNSNSKGMNTMSNNSKNTEQVDRTADEAECDRFNQHFCDRRNWSHFYGDEATDYFQWCSQFRECGLTRLADRISTFRRIGALDVEFTPAEQADLELAEIALRNLSTQTTGQDDQAHPNDDGEGDRWSLQAAVDAVSIERDEWEKSALEMTDERDDLRALLAARDTEIDQLRAQKKELERTILYLASTAAYLGRAHDANRNTEELLLAERRMKQRCQAERQANENEPARTHENCPF